MKIKRKFSVVEIIIVVVIVAIVAALYMVSRGDLSNVSIDAASRKVQADILYARQIAVETGVNHGVAFLDDGTYEVYSGDPGTSVVDPVTNDRLVVNLPEFNNVAVSNDYRVEFDPQGKAVIGGDKKVRLTAGGGSVRDVYVVGKTGEVIIDQVEWSGCSLVR